MIIDNDVDLLWVYPLQYAPADTTTVSLSATLLVPFGTHDIIYSDWGTHSVSAWSLQQGTI